ncbi:hypothetical protein D3C76_1502310 [compost metagenome]
MLLRQHYYDAIATVFLGIGEWWGGTGDLGAHKRVFWRVGAANWIYVGINVFWRE